jgi:predicted nucleic acid-binding protein
MKILLDTSIWIDYFKGGQCSDKVDRLIEMNVVAVCDVVLVELIPFLRHKSEDRLVKLLHKVPLLSYDLNWQTLTNNQLVCLTNGINKVGITDLMIAETVKQNNSMLCSLDRHFYLMSGLLGFDIYDL